MTNATLYISKTNEGVVLDKKDFFIAEEDFNLQKVVLLLLANPNIRAIYLLVVEDQTKKVIDSFWKREYLYIDNTYQLLKFPEIKISGKIADQHLQLVTTFVDVYDGKAFGGELLPPFYKEPIIYDL